MGRGERQRLGGLAGALIALGAGACDGGRDARGLPPAPEHAIEITRIGQGQGLVRSEPEGLACGTDCRQAFPEGTTVRLVAEPLFGSTFAGWSGECDGFLPECELEVIGERFVGVRFAAQAGDAGVGVDGGLPGADGGVPDAGPPPDPDGGVADGGLDGSVDGGDGGLDGAVGDAGVAQTGPDAG